MDINGEVLIYIQSMNDHKWIVVTGNDSNQVILDKDNYSRVAHAILSLGAKL